MGDACSIIVRNVTCHSRSAGDQRRYEHEGIASLAVLPVKPEDTFNQQRILSACVA